MKASTFSAVSLLRFRAWLLAAIVLSLVTSVTSVFAQAGLPAYYSTAGPNNIVQTGGTVAVNTTASAGALGIVAAIQVNGVSVLGPLVSVRYALNGEAPAGYRAGVVLANTSGTLSLTALGAVRLRTYLGGAVRETRLVRADVVQSSLGGNGLPTQLEFTSTLSFDAVEFEVLSVASISRSFNVFYAYGVRPGIQTRASGYLSRFTSPVLDTDYRASLSTGPLVALCVSTDVARASEVADNSLTNFATLRSTASVSCNPTLYARLAGVPTGGVPGGHYAGFVIGQNSLLDVSVLSGLEISTYLGNTLVETRSGLNLLNLSLLPGNKAQVSFKTSSTQPFDGVRISRVGLLQSVDLTALDDLDVYYAFGLEPQAFEGINPLFSNFSNPRLSLEYFTSAPPITVDLNVTLGLVTTRTTAQLSVSSVTTPAAAADASIPTTTAGANYAQLNTLGVDLSSLNILGAVTLATPITTGATASLKLKLNGTGKAGNRVGFAVNQGSGLLDLNALQRLTIATYDADNRLIETKTGSSLLSVTLLGSTDINRISFLASRDFTYAEITVNSAVSLASNTRVYYAFAEDVPVISLAAPLPVELTAFTGKWAGGAAELNWATASEKNSSHFVVERSTGEEAEFLPVGQVAAAGSSSTPKTYRLRDAEAGTLGLKVLYYRLRQVDNDGKQAFSPVVSVAVGPTALAGTQLEVYPNPVANGQGLTMRYANLPATGATLLTYSQLGQLVSQQPVAEANARLALPVLTPGLYFMVLRDATGQQLATQRLVIEGR